MRLTQSIHRGALIAANVQATSCGARNHSWAELKSRIAKLAGAMHRLGVHEGDRIAVLGLNSDRYFELYFAAPWAGAVLVPMNNRWSVAEHVYSIRDSGASVLFVDAAYLDTARAVRAECPTVRHIVFMGDEPCAPDCDGYEDLIEEAGEAPDVEHGGQDLAGLFYTGGTTGYPKGVMLSHQGLWFGANAVGQAVGLDASSRYLHAAPMFHLADGALSYAVTLFNGSHVFIPAFEPKLLLETIERARITHVLLVPTMIKLLLDCPDIEKYDLSSWRLLIYGASPMPEALLRQALDRLPHVGFLQAYGQTELSPLCSTLGPEWHRRDELKPDKLRSAGLPAFAMEVKIADETGTELPRDEVGEVWARGPNVMLGYWNMPEQTAATLVDGWVRTGDGGTMDEEGFIYIVDRIKDMIVSGGENVFSAEVENAVMMHPAIGECAVIGVPDPVWGERVHAVVVPKEGAAVTAEELIVHCKRLIAGYKCPRSVEVRSEPLPKSGAGKILKTDLRAPHWEGQTRNVN